MARRDEPEAAARAAAHSAASIESISMTFYERALQALRVPYEIGSMLFGGAVVVAHAIVAQFFGVSIWADRSVFMGPLIAIYLIVLVSATRSLRTFVEGLATLVGDGRIASEFIDGRMLQEISRTRRIAMIGLLSGGFSAGVGLAYGHWYESWPLSASLALQHGIYGAIGGIGAWGIYLVTRFVRRLGGGFQLRLDYFSPDNCGGTGIIGRLVFRFAMYCLVMAFLTGAYVYASPWSRRGSGGIAEVLAVGIVAAQILASLVVFTYPVLRLHGHLAAYKRSEHGSIREKLRDQARKLDDVAPGLPDGAEKVNGILSAYRHYQELETTLLRMSTWPYDMRLRLAYVGSLVSPVPVTALAESVSRYLAA